MLILDVLFNCLNLDCNNNLDDRRVVLVANEFHLSIKHQFQRVLASAKLQEINKPAPNETISASVVERAVEVCFLLAHESGCSGNAA